MPIEGVPPHRVWLVDCEGTPDPREVVADSARDAARRWVVERGHETDDQPIVTVTRHDGKVFVYQMEASVRWNAYGVGL